MFLTNQARKVSIVALAAGALAVFAQFPGVAGAQAASGDVDGRDFLVWQRGGSPVLNDADVDGRDFLKWQRGNSANPLSSGDLAMWQSNYGQTY